MCVISSDSRFLSSFCLFDFHVGVQFGDTAFLFGVCLLDADILFRFRFGHLRFFFCVGKGYLRDSLLIRIRYRDFLLLLGFGDGDILVFAGFRNLCFTFLYLIGNFDSTQLFLFFDVGLCFVQSLAFSFLTQVDDVVGSVADITDVDVHQI